MQQKHLDQDKYSSKQKHSKMFTTRKMNLDKISTPTSKFAAGYMKRLDKKSLLDQALSK